MGLTESGPFDVIPAEGHYDFGIPISSLFPPSLQTPSSPWATQTQSGLQSKAGLVFPPMEGPLLGHKITLSEIRLKILKTFRRM